MIIPKHHPSYAMILDHKVCQTLRARLKVIMGKKDYIKEKNVLNSDAIAKSYSFNTLLHELRLGFFPLVYAHESYVQ